MLTVRDIMTKPVVVIRSSATVKQAIGLMWTQGVRSLIIDKCHADGSYGILTEKDIVYKVIAPGDDPSLVCVCSIMRQPCIQVPSSATLQEAAQILASAGVHRAPVIEHNQLLGIVSVTDILTKEIPASPLPEHLPRDIAANPQMGQEQNLDRQIFEDRYLSSTLYTQSHSNF